MIFYYYGPELKLKQHHCVEFHGDSDGNGFKTQIPIIDLLIGSNLPKCPLVPPKMEFFKFGLEPKVDHHSCVDFRSDSDGDGFKAQKPKIDLQIGPN